MTKEQIALEMTKTIFASIGQKKTNEDSLIEQVVRVYKKTLNKLSLEQKNHSDGKPS